MYPREVTDNSPLPTQTIHWPTAPTDTVFPHEWVRCAPFISAAINRSSSTHDMGDVLEAIQTHAAQFWPGANCAGVTEVVSYPRRKVIRLWLAGGDMEELQTLHNEAIEWGREQGCDWSEVVGRRGWLKALADYEEIATVIGKRI